MTSLAPALAVRGLRKAFGRHQVLDGVSLALPPGTIAVLSGSNGAGKSTLLRCLAGLARFEGDATVDGQAVDASSAHRRRIAYVPQQVSLPETGTVGEVMRLFAKLRGAALGALPFPPGFVPPADRPVGVLSGGQQQRVVVAAALLGAPKLLLLDEPAANLDESGLEQLWEGVRALRDTGVSALIASPLRGGLAASADRELVLEGGRITHDAPHRTLHALAPPGAERLGDAHLEAR